MLLRANKFRKDKESDCRRNELGSRIFMGRVFGDYAECLHFYPSFSYGRIIAGQSRGVVRAPRRSHLPAVRAVWSFKRGVTERGKIAPVGSQFEKSPPFQGKRRGCTKKVHGKRKKQQVQRWVKQLRVYREKQLAGLKTCKLPSKKSVLYCTRDPARIRRTIICRNNIDTDPPYWVLLVPRRVEGRFR